MIAIPPSLRGCRAAFVFMTRLKVGGVALSVEDFRWAPAYFPLVGLFVGTWGALVFVMMRPLGSLVASTLALVATVWMTGALHEDGLADTADALGGTHDREKIFEILKDSRLGTYGSTALCLSLLLRVSILAELDMKSPFELSTGLSAPVALVLVHLLARTGPVAIMASLPYVTGRGAKSSLMVEGNCRPQAVCAGVWAACAILLLLLAGAPAFLMMLLVSAGGLSTVLAARCFHLRAGGFTGDFLGATEQVLELVLFLVILAYQQQVKLGELWPVYS